MISDRFWHGSGQQLRKNKHLCKKPACRLLYSGEDMASDSASKAYEYAVKLLTRKDYSEYELRQKLKSRCSQSDADEIILRLQENRYQSDERCAEMLAEYLQRE